MSVPVPIVDCEGEAPHGRPCTRRVGLHPAALVLDADGEGARVLCRDCRHDADPEPDPADWWR